MDIVIRYYMIYSIIYSNTAVFYILFFYRIKQLKEPWKCILKFFISNISKRRA